MSEQTQTREPAGATDPEPRTRRSSSAPWWSVVVLLAVVALLAGLLIGATGPGAGSPAADSVDVGFAQDMSVHHRQAVEMASWERDRTADPALRQLAYDMESTQNQQLGRMQGWLGLWDQPAYPSGGHMAWMGSAHGSGMSGMGSMTTMPGMASSADLRRMRQTPEPALDVVFLQLMLRHHEGGRGMLEYGRDHAETVEVRNLASQMLSSQGSEAELMKQLLARRGAQPLPL